jgi:hypothetical protein
MTTANYFDHDETRTRNLLIRSQTPYPLGHAVLTYLAEDKEWMAAGVNEVGGL